MHNTIFSLQVYRNEQNIFRVHTSNLNNKASYARFCSTFNELFMGLNTIENSAKYRILLTLAMHYNCFIYIILPCATSIELMKF